MALPDCILAVAISKSKPSNSGRYQEVLWKCYSGWTCGFEWIQATNGLFSFRQHTNTNHWPTHWKTCSVIVRIVWLILPFKDEKVTRYFHYNGSFKVKLILNQLVPNTSVFLDDWHQDVKKLRSKIWFGFYLQRACLDLFSTMRMFYIDLPHWWA